MRPVKKHRPECPPSAYIRKNRLSEEFIRRARMNASRTWGLATFGRLRPCLLSNFVSIMPLNPGLSMGLT